MSVKSSPSSGRSSLQVPRSTSPRLSPPSSVGGRGTVYPQWRAPDLRSSSAQSLVPSESEAGPGANARRTLLLVYIHGFMGNDSSFRSFPAHVHNYLKLALAESHVIHSKIYPRYKTYKAIDVARDNFSIWLQPHESDTTDVILVGHSMGGLLAADVVLTPNKNPGAGWPFQHRVLGTISLDSPFLGLHPGVIVSGIASLFRPAAGPPKDASASHALTGSPDPSGSLSPDPSLYSELSPGSGVTSPATTVSPLDSAAPDPFFNPPFFNDVLFRDRGWFKNIAHFAKKHKSENIMEAAANHVMSHLEFGGCMADYPALHSRYEKLRRLEDVDGPDSRDRERSGLVRVRFVNYFTISTGKPKSPKPQSPHLKPKQAEVRSSLESESRVSTPRISIEDHSDNDKPQILEELDPEPEPDTPPYFATVSSNEEPQLATGTSSSSSRPGDLMLPAIPPIPEPPELPDPGMYPDKDSKKQAEKEVRRAQKAYYQAVKDREKAIKERQKLIEKLRRKAQKEAEKREKEERRRLEREELAFKKEAKRAAMAATASPPPEKKKKRKFCMLPRKVNGVRDGVWVQIYMEGVDEVGAHCGLFLPGPHYERLVGDVGLRIVSWVHENATERAMLSMD